MDEAEKYKQRLEAIAEKRRQQEEQDKARREMEDERLRLKQLKRKSLRDQWLMEGAPLSPTSPDTQSPRSPLWGFQAEEIDKHMDKLQSESQQLSEEEEKLKEQMEDGQTQKTVKPTEAEEEMAPDVFMQNGENTAAGSEAAADQVKTNQSPLQNENAVILSNGGRDFNTNTNHNASKQSTQSITNGPVCITGDVVSVKLEPGLSLGVSEAEPGHDPNVNINEEEEEEGGTLVMRAECVIITDEGDDVPEDLMSQEDQQETMQSEGSPLPKPEVSKEGEEEEVSKTDRALETITRPEETEATGPAAETQTAAEDGDEEGDIKTNDDGDAERDGQDKHLVDPTSVQLQSPANAQEGTTVASVPVYSETQPSSPAPKVEGQAAVSPEGAEATLKAEDTTMSSQFQEVPLADPQENQSTEAKLEEQEPLLLQSKAHNTQAAPAVANSPISTETHVRARAAQAEETEAPNRKTCQCCSVM